MATPAAVRPGCTGTLATFPSGGSVLRHAGLPCPVCEPFRPDVDPPDVDPPDVLIVLTDALKLTERAAIFVDDAPLTVGDLARLLTTCDAINVLLNAITGVVTEHLASRMEADEVEVPGVGWLKREGRKSDTWRDTDSRERMFDDVKAGIATNFGTDPLTGEVNPAVKRLVGLVCDELADALSLGSFKAGFRKRLHLDPDDYRTVDPVGNGYKITVVTPFGQDGP